MKKLTAKMNFQPKRTVFKVKTHVTIRNHFVFKKTTTFLF